MCSQDQYYKRVDLRSVPSSDYESVGVWSDSHACFARSLGLQELRFAGEEVEARDAVICAHRHAELRADRRAHHCSKGDMVSVGSAVPKS